MKNEKKNSYIKLPASIFNFDADRKIKAFGREFAVLVYLYMLAQINRTDTVTVRLQTIANRCGINNKSNVVRLIDILEEHGYITKKKNRFLVSNLQATSSYKLTNPNPDKYVLLPLYLFNDIIKAVSKADMNAVPETGKLLYIISFVSYCCGSEAECFPSYVEISRATGLSESVISRYLTFLSDNNVIVKMRYQRKNGTYGRNHYFFVKRLEAALGKATATGLKLMMETKRAIYKELHYYKAVVAGLIAFTNAQTTEQECVPIAPEQKNKRVQPTCTLLHKCRSFARFVINKAVSIVEKAKKKLSSCFPHYEV